MREPILIVFIFFTFTILDIISLKMISHYFLKILVRMNISCMFLAHAAHTERNRSGHNVVPLFSLIFKSLLGLKILTFDSFVANISPQFVVCFLFCLSWGNLFISSFSICYCLERTF